MNKKLNSLYSRILNKINTNQLLKQYNNVLQNTLQDVNTSKIEHILNS